MTDRPGTERILIVEDEEPLAKLLEKTLRNAGYTDVSVINDPRQALPMVREWEPDLVVMDIGMPHIDGIAVMQQIRARRGKDEFLPVVLITGDIAPETRQKALAAGASDYLTKPFDSVEVMLRIRNLLTLRRMHRELHDSAERSAERLAQTRVDMVKRLVKAAGYRDVGIGSDSAANATQVGELSAHIARAMGRPEEEVERIRLAAPLHDVGMVGIPDDIVNKQTSLSLEELDQIKAHTSIGAHILANSDSPLLQLAEEIALYHHEAWDGSGYTPGLKGDLIPLAARIVAVADTFYAMTQQRPYQGARPVEEAVAWIKGESGRRFDPEVVRAFERVCAVNDLPLLKAEPGTGW
jgi:putative two-component system response regulator